MTAVVQELGAVAGLACVAGLTVLAVLFRAHARQVRWLRAWAGTAPERAARSAAAAPRGRPAMTVRSRRRIGGPSLAVGLAGVVVVAGAVMWRSGGDGAGDAGHARARRKAAAPPRRAAPAVVPGEVTVAVLNGTLVDGLAATLRERLAAAGFRKGIINVYFDQQRAASVVQYAPGHEAAAHAVGRRLGIADRAPMTAESRAAGGDATVIVIAGADQTP